VTDHQKTKSPNRSMVVVLASTSPAKVDAVHRALERIGGIDASFSNATLRTLDVTGVSPRMPMTDKETLDGARLRAATAARSIQPPFVAIGLEGGISEDPLATLTSWAAATDGQRWGYGAGGRIVLPDAVMTQVRAGRELGDVIDEMAGAQIRGTRGAWGWLTRDLVGRRQALLIAALAALAPFYNRDLYRDIR
jgi:inosine/xanthosine triphosphatase